MHTCIFDEKGVIACKPICRFRLRYPNALLAMHSARKRPFQDLLEDDPRNMVREVTSAQPSRDSQEQGSRTEKKRGNRRRRRVHREWENAAQSTQGQRESEQEELEGKKKQESESEAKNNKGESETQNAPEILKLLRAEPTESRIATSSSAQPGEKEGQIAERTRNKTRRAGQQLVKKIANPWVADATEPAGEEIAVNSVPEDKAESRPKSKRKSKENNQDCKDGESDRRTKTQEKMLARPPLSRAAAAMLESNKRNRPVCMYYIFTRKYGDLSAETSLSSMEQCLKRLGRLRSAYRGKKYSPHKDTFANNVGRILKTLETHTGCQSWIQECCEMQVEFALRARRFSNISVPLWRLMEIYQRADILSEKATENIGHWLLSLLFRRRREQVLEDVKELASAEEIAEYLRVNHSLDLEISKIPPAALDSPLVRHALAVLRAVLGGNHARFFDLYENSPAHLLTSSRSRDAMGPFAAWMRQQAIVMWASHGARGGEGGDFPQQTKIARVVEELYAEFADEPERQADAARQDVRAVGVRIVVPRSVHVGEYMIARPARPRFRMLPLVDMATTLGAAFCRWRVRFLLEDAADSED